MSKIVLEKDENNPVGGVVLASRGGGGQRPTGVFLPDAGVLGGPQALTVLLWFHGHFVKDIASLFYREETKLLQAVIDSERRIVLVAPHLGYYENKEKSSYIASALGGGKTSEHYLDQVLDAVSDWYLSTLVVGNAASKTPPKFQIADLYVAGHSGGGVAIQSSVAALGKYKDALRGCWGFDCLYGSGESWNQWARAQPLIPLYFYFGKGTQPSNHGDVLGLWKRAYGTPKRPLQLGGRMLNLFLAPALPGTELDMVAFQFTEDIMAKSVPGNRYEEVRRKVDPLLDSPDDYWRTLKAEGLMGHYPVVSELLGPRIRQSIY